MGGTVRTYDAKFRDGIIDQMHRILKGITEAHGASYEMEYRKTYPSIQNDMKLIEAEFSVDFAVLPIGDTFTMGPEDAARADSFVGTSKVIGVHFDTFPPIAINHDTARRHFKDLGIELVLPVIGETIAL